MSNEFGEIIMATTEVAVFFVDGKYTARNPKTGVELTNWPVEAISWAACHKKYAAEMAAHAREAILAHKNLINDDYVRILEVSGAENEETIKRLYSFSMKNPLAHSMWPQSN